MHRELRLFCFSFVFCILTCLCIYFILGDHHHIVRLCLTSAVFLRALLVKLRPQIRVYYTSEYAELTYFEHDAKCLCGCLEACVAVSRSGEAALFEAAHVKFSHRHFAVPLFLS